MWIFVTHKRTHSPDRFHSSIKSISGRESRNCIRAMRKYTLVDVHRRHRLCVRDNVCRILRAIGLQLTCSIRVQNIGTFSDPVHFDQRARIADAHRQSVDRRATKLGACANRMLYLLYLLSRTCSC